MKRLYTDASFDHRSTDKTAENIVRGKIAIADGLGFAKVDKVAVGKVEGLKQYINVLELTAVARAIELACEMKDCEGSLVVFTDSQTAMYWARAAKIKDSVRTVAHDNALEYLRNARIKFGGIVTFDFVPREKNFAGWLLAEELEKEPPHTL